MKKSVKKNYQLNHNPKPEKSLAIAPTKKKVGFISAIMIVIGSSIGAGIFFKSSTVLQSSGSNLYWAIFCWVIAGFAAISMALALIEISSVNNDNLSMIGWCKTFNGKYLYKGCKYFMTFIYLPLNFFFMPIYVIMSFQDALTGFGLNNNFNTANDWAIWMIISLVISTWFIFLSGLYSKAANIQNWIITFFKFIPLIVAAILGFVLAGKPVINSDGSVLGGVNNVNSIDWWNNQATDLFELTPFFGTFGAIAAIFFAFDGFYVTAGMQSEMKEPKKTPLAISIGLIIVTAVYLLIAISMSLGSAGGNFYSFKDWLGEHNVSWLFGVVNLLIAFGVLGIINGFSLWAPRFIEDLIKEGELSVPRKYLFKLNNNKPLVGTLYTYFISIPIVVIFSVIGGLAYFPTRNYFASDGSSLYDGQGYFSMIRLLSFADLMATWISLFAFAFIAFAIFGGLANRKTKEIKTIKLKYFVFTAWISVIIVGLSLLFSIVQPFVNLGLIAANGISGNNEAFTGTIILCVILILFAIACFSPMWLEQLLTIRKINKLKILKQAIVNFEIIKQIKIKSAQNSKLFIKLLTDKMHLNQKEATQVNQLPWHFALNSEEQFMEHFNVKSIDMLLEITQKNLNSFKIKRHYFIKKDCSKF